MAGLTVNGAIVVVLVGFGAGFPFKLQMNSRLDQTSNQCQRQAEVLQGPDLVVKATGVFQHVGAASNVVNLGIQDSAPLVVGAMSGYIVHRALRMHAALVPSL